MANDVVGVWQWLAINGGRVIGQNCKVGNIYKKQCKPGEVCKPIEGSFCTECEVKNCNRFC